MKKLFNFFKQLFRKPQSAPFRGFWIYFDENGVSNVTNFENNEVHFSISGLDDGKFHKIVWMCDNGKEAPKDSAQPASI